MNSIPTLYLDGVLSVVRHLLTVTAGWLVSRGLVSAEQGTQFVELGAGVMVFALTIGWSLWQKHTAKKSLVVAMKAGDTTELEVRQKVATGIGVPSVLTPPSLVPVSPVRKG